MNTAIPAFVYCGKPQGMVVVEGRGLVRAVLLKSIEERSGGVFHPRIAGLF